MTSFGNTQQRGSEMSCAFASVIDVGLGWSDGLCGCCWQKGAIKKGGVHD